MCHDNDKFSKETKIINGEDCIAQFIKELIDVVEPDILTYIRRFKNTPIIMTDKQKMDYEKAEKCYLCGDYFSEAEIFFIILRENFRTRLKVI